MCLLQVSWTKERWIVLQICGFSTFLFPFKFCLSQVWREKEQWIVCIRVAYLLFDLFHVFLILFICVSQVWRERAMDCVRMRAYDYFNYFSLLLVYLSTVNMAGEVSIVCLIFFNVRVCVCVCVFRSLSYRYGGRRSNGLFSWSGTFLLRHVSPSTCVCVRVCVCVYVCVCL